MRRPRVAWSVLIFIAGCASGVGSTPPGVASPPASASPAPSPSPSAADIAWSSETPRPFLTPAPTQLPDARPCRADQLSAFAGWEGATGSMLGSFLVWNTSPEPCRLAGVPSVAFVDAAGHRLKVTDVPDARVAARPLVLSAGQRAPVLHEEAPAGLASVTFQWFNWCGSLPAGPLRMAITLPEGGVVRTPGVVGGSPRCDAPTAGSSLTVVAFEATLGPGPTDPPPVPAEPLDVSLEAPDQVTAGQTPHYVAVLTNPTSVPIALRPCPAYMERVNSAGGPVVADYLLACASVPIIAPGASVRFAMELDIPASLTASDGAALVWTLDPYHSAGFSPRPPGQKVPIRIVAP